MLSEDFLGETPLPKPVHFEIPSLVKLVKCFPKSSRSTPKHWIVRYYIQDYDIVTMCADQIEHVKTLLEQLQPKM